MSNLSSSLSKIQREAVENIKEPILILAGPGTGKTRVMIAKIIHLVQSGVDPYKVLAMTFSRRAVGEIEERLLKEAPEVYGRTQVTTIHALCLDLVQKHAFRLGFGRRTQLMSETQSALLLRSMLHRTPVHQYFKQIASDDLIENLLALFSECKDNGIWPEQLVSYSHQMSAKTLEEKELKTEWIALSETYQAFQSYCLDKGFMDFGDALMAAVRLLDEHPNVRTDVQKEYEAILVDEFQDTSWIQIQLLRHLVSPTAHVSVVGDDDQAIYRFRGASYSAFSFFEKEFPNFKVVDLNETYRLPSAIAEAASALIQRNGKNRFRPDKKIISKNSEKTPVQIWQFSDYEDEAKQIVEKIDALIQSGVRAKEIAILARSHGHLDEIVRLAKNKNIPLQLSSSRNLYESEIVRDVMSYLAVLFQPSDSVSLMRLFDSPFLGLSADEIIEFSERAQFKNSSYFKILEKISDIEISKALKEKLQLFSDTLKKLAAQGFSKKLSEVLFEIYKTSGVIQKLENSQLEWAHDLALFHEQVQAWENLQENQDFRVLFPLLQNLVNKKLKLGEDEAETEDNRVRCLTVHASKGLEFDHVFVVSLVGRRFPSNFSQNAFKIPESFRHEAAPNKETHEHEERRLFYVAMTRAKKELILSTISRKGTKPSLFLSEDLKGLSAKFLVHKEWPAPSSPVERLQQRVEVFSRVEERTPPRRSQKPLSLSFTQISDYEECPKKYWFRYELKIPVPPKSFMSFGSAMHEALEHFYKEVGDDTPDLQKLLSLFETSFKNFQRTDAGLSDEDYEKGVSALTDYFESQNGNFKKPIAIEEKFQLELGKHTLKGKIDRVDSSEDGVTIIDYKTGKSFKKVEEESDKNALQFSVYALAAKDFFKWNVKEMLFYNLMDQSVLRTTRTDDQIEETRKNVVSLAEQIQKGEFVAKPGFACRFCDFKTICPSAKY